MAVTDYQVDEYLRVPDLYGGEEGYPEGLTMVWLYPKTGRTHQLRVHLRHMHHSIVADRVYLSKKRLKYDLVWCKRHFLHAQSITFVIPKREKKITVQAPLPNDLTQAIVRVRTDG
jgi:23S rRNA-/tRNA-specific pseudouridylate synthase